MTSHNQYIVDDDNVCKFLSEPASWKIHELNFNYCYGNMPPHQTRTLKLSNNNKTKSSNITGIANDVQWCFEILSDILYLDGGDDDHSVDEHVNDGGADDDDWALIGAGSSFAAARRICGGEVSRWTEEL